MHFQFLSSEGEKMNEQINLEYYRHFIECYYPLPMPWLTLEEATKEYKRIESPNRVKGLFEDLGDINKFGNWKFIKEFSYKHGLFDYSVEKLKDMVNTMLKVLND